MPGPVSDSYDPEWGTSDKGAQIGEALDDMYARLTEILGGRSPHYILDLVQEDLPEEIPATLTEKEWRILRFAIERARESI